METVMLGNQGQLVLPKVIRDIPVSQLEPLDTPSVYQGTPLSIEDMEKAIDIEAGKQLLRGETTMLELAHLRNRLALSQFDEPEQILLNRIKEKVKH